MMNKEEFLGYLGKMSDKVDDEIEHMISAEEHFLNLHDGVEYALGLDVNDRKKRGKRIRPVLCLMTCEDLGGDYRMAMPFAIAIEFLHNYTLVHDDIQDGDRTRRDRDAVWVKYGMEHGINIGDFIAAKVYRSILRSRDAGVDENITLQLFKLAIETMEHTAQGQALDIGSRAKKNITIEEYMQTVTEKTGYYLAAPMVGGAIVAKAQKQVIESIIEFGKYIGPMFQIVDDILDLTEGKGRGEIGSDIKEGKRSYLVAYSMSKCSLEEKEMLFNILDKPRNKTTTQDVQKVIDIFERYDTINEARNHAEKLRALGDAILLRLPVNLRERLSFAAKFMLDRKI